MLTIVVVAAGMLAGTAQGAAAAANPETERGATEERRAEVAAELDELTATATELEAELERLATSIATRRDELDAARREVEETEAKVAATEAKAAKTKRSIAALESQVARRAVTEFMDPPKFELDAFIRTNDVGQAGRAESLLGAVAARDGAAVDDLQRAKRRLAAQQATAASAAEQAAERRTRLGDDLAALEADRARQEELREALDVRIAEFVEEAEALAVAEADLTELIEARNGAAGAGGDAAPVSATTRGGAGRLGWPAEGRVTSEYGPRWGRLHAGLDIAAPIGTPIYAAGDGTAYSVGVMRGYGNVILLDHGGGLTTLYAHQSRFAVKAGERVTRGQLIGYVGNTGDSTGPHLHFETRVGSSPKDPRQLLGSAR